MDVLRVPQHEVKVRVQLLDRRDLAGVMYVPSTGPDGGQGRLIDRLNDEAERFLPLTVDGKTQLVQDSHLLVVEVRDEAEENIGRPVEESQLSRHLEVEITMTSGVEIQGRLSYLQPVESERLQDYLNVDRRFLPLHVDGRLVYVNRNQILSVRAVSGE